MQSASSPPPQANKAGKGPRNGRWVAVQVLCQLERERSSVKSLLERLALDLRLSELERGLAMQLVFGVLRQRQVLERMIALLSRTPIKKIDPFIWQTLMVGLYQLFFLDRIPAPAAVHAMVELVKGQRRLQRLEGFVNGILRQALRDREPLFQKAQYDLAGQPLLNHPPWLVARWRNQFGAAETARICRSNNQEPRLVLRVNTRRIDRQGLLALLAEQGVTAEPGSYAGEAVVLPDYRGKISSLPGYHQGYFLVQDEAAQLAATLLAPLRRGGSYLDACAGVGGKTMLLLQHAQEHDLLVHAVEPDNERFLRLGENSARLGLSTNLTSHRQTLQGFAAETAARFDGILIDAPCSGTGVTGRHPDIRWNRQPEDLPAYHKEQLLLLDCGARLLAPDGILVYATCSLEPEENQEAVATFLASHPDFALEDCTPFLPEAARPLIAGGCFRPLPDRGIDGFFAARLRHR